MNECCDIIEKVVSFILFLSAFGIVFILFCIPDLISEWINRNKAKEVKSERSG